MEKKTGFKKQVLLRKFLLVMQVIDDRSRIPVFSIDNFDQNIKYFFKSLYQKKLYWHLRAALYQSSCITIVRELFEFPVTEIFRLVMGRVGKSRV